jgi:hypothetical protein
LSNARDDNVKIYLGHWVNGVLNISPAQLVYSSTHAVSALHNQGMSGSLRALHRDKRSWL